jgi:peptidoglycan hydrolase-like protein with peptidoglycan-binding domain
VGSPAWAEMGGMPVSVVQWTNTPHDQNIAHMPFADLWALWEGRPAPVYVHPEGSRTLELTHPNLKGHDVKFVQDRIGAAHAGTANGVFGTNTQAGVMWWQSQHGLQRDGQVGPLTWHSFGVTYTGK